MGIILMPRFSKTLSLTKNNINTSRVRTLCSKAKKQIPAPLLPHIPLQLPHSQQHRNISPRPPHIITRLGQQMRLDGRLLENIRPGKHLSGTGIHQYPPVFHHNGPAGIFCHHTHIMAYQDYRFPCFVQHLHPGKELVQMSPVLPGSRFVQHNNIRFHGQYGSHSQPLPLAPAQ